MAAPKKRPIGAQLASRIAAQMSQAIVRHPGAPPFNPAPGSTHVVLVHPDKSLAGWNAVIHSTASQADTMNAGHPANKAFNRAIRERDRLAQSVPAPAADEPSLSIRQHLRKSRRFAHVGVSYDNEGDNTLVPAGQVFISYVIGAKFRSLGMFKRRR